MRVRQERLNDPAFLFITSAQSLRYCLRLSLLVAISKGLGGFGISTTGINLPTLMPFSIRMVSNHDCERIRASVQPSESCSESQWESPPVYMETPRLTMSLPTHHLVQEVATLPLIGPVIRLNQHRVGNRAEQLSGSQELVLDG